MSESFREALIGARGTFCGSHTLPSHPGVHGHSYEVWAFVEPPTDAEEVQRSVAAICRTGWAVRGLPASRLPHEQDALRGVPTPPRTGWAGRGRR